MLTRIASVLAVLTIITTIAAGVGAQKAQDCRTKEDVPSIFGHWKDDQTNREVDIRPKRAADDIIANYSEAHDCPQPDASGNPVPAPVEFEGSYTTKSFE